MVYIRVKIDVISKKGGDHDAAHESQVTARIFTDDLWGPTSQNKIH